MATMQADSPSQYTAAVEVPSPDPSKDRKYLERRYEKVLAYHNEPGNTPEEIARFARELDEISAMIRSISES